VLELVDDALKSASEAGRKASRQVDEKFARAISALCDYEKDCYLKDRVSDDRRGHTVRERMAAAGAKDKGALSALNVLKEKLRSTKVRVALHWYMLPCPLLIPALSRPQMDGRNRRNSSHSFSSSHFLMTPPWLCTVSANYQP
jgi:hypothetical protein